jgi:c-di-GMP-binding flagellar brake protein YcgR
MVQDTRPAPLDSAETAAALDEFRISQPKEVLRWLQQLREADVPVILNGPDGQSYSATLWTTDSANQRMTFSADDQHLQLQRLVDGDEIVAVAYLDAVKLQFEVRQAVLVRSAQGCALHARLPRELFRFQRRGSFRVRTGERQGPVAQLRHPSIPDMQLTLRVLDVSIGGCALWLPQDVPDLQPGTRLSQVRIELDADTRFAAGLLLHHVASAAGGGGRRLGFEWASIESSAQRALQRFIDHAQKRRRFLSLS